MIYYIPSDNYEKLKQKLDKISKKCEKYGNPFKFEDLGEEYRKISKFYLLSSEEQRLAKQTNAKLETVPLKFHKIDVEGVAKINDWEYIGTIYKADHGNLIKSIKDINIPSKYYADEPCCEHCYKKIQRKFTYLVYNTKTCEFKSVGKTCLKDYTGIDAELITYINQFFKIAKDFETAYNGIKYPKTFDIEKLLRITSEICRLNGGYNLNLGYPTHVTASNIYKMIEFGYSYPAIEKLADDLDLYSNETNAILPKCIEYMKNSDNQNLKVMSECEQAPLTFMHDVAIVLSNFYEIKKKTEYEYFGNVGSKFEITADLKLTSTFEGEYGLTNIYVFKAEKSIFRWITSKSIENGKYKIQGVIKKHEEYNETKWTIVTRCKVFELS